MRQFLISLVLFTLTNCAIINEYIECENNRDKMYPSAVSNCSQSEKEMNNKTDPTNPTPPGR
jgi:hypothetical protein